MSGDEPIRDDFDHDQQRRHLVAGVVDSLNDRSLDRIGLLRIAHRPKCACRDHRCAKHQLFDHQNLPEERRARKRRLSKGHANSAICAATSRSRRVEPTMESARMYKFEFGQSVSLQSTLFNRDAARGAYKVTKQLPERDDEFKYQVKRPGEPHERVVKENDLSAG